MEVAGTEHDEPGHVAGGAAAHDVAGLQLTEGTAVDHQRGGTVARHGEADLGVVVETCERRVRGRRTVTAELHATDDFFVKD